MKIESWAVGRVVPYEKNPRKIGEDAIAAVAASIKEFGFRQPIVVDKAGVIIVGHTRFLAAQSLGMTKVPVHVATDLSEAQIRAYRIADNKTGELAEWDKGLLKFEIGELGDFDLSSLAFNQDELRLVMGEESGIGAVDPDSVPLPPDEARTRPGDLWVLGSHRLLCGDSGSVEDLDRLLGGEVIHLVNMDPPYNVKVEPRPNNAIAAGLSSFPSHKNHHQGLDLARHPEKAKPTGKKLRAKDRPLANDFVTDEAFDGMLDAWFGNAARVLVPGRGFYIWGGYANCANYQPFLKKHELYFSQAIIWVKEHPVMTRKDMMGNHEWCFYGWKLGAGHEWLGPRNVPDVWQVSRQGVSRVHSVGNGLRLEDADGSRLDVLPGGDGEMRTLVVGEEPVSISTAPSDVWTVKKVNPQGMVHLTEKPVELAARAMRYSSRPGENVLDLFGGSGSTLIAAEQLGRNAFLMELDPLYCDVIVKRWEEFTGKKAKVTHAKVSK